MIKQKGAASRRAVLAAGGLGGLAVMAGFAATADAADRSQSSAEREAIRVASNFIASFRGKDFDQMASYLADDVVFREAPSAPERMGKQAFIEAARRFFSSPIAQQREFARRPSAAYAFGGEPGVAVFTSRIDRLNRNGRLVPVSTAAAFWIKNGKIQAWYDFPLGNSHA